MISPSCIVDAADCPIWEPENMPRHVRQKFYSRKCGGPGLKYGFAVHCETGEFLWLSTAYPGGASEARIFIEELCWLQIDGERYLADRLFRHYPTQFLTSSGGSTPRDLRIDSVSHAWSGRLEGCTRSSFLAQPTGLPTTNTIQLQFP